MADRAPLASLAMHSHRWNLCHLAPAGHTYMEQLNEAGGIYAVMNELNKKGLLQRLYDLGYESKRRSFTPLEVRVIVDALGEP